MSTKHIFLADKSQSSLSVVSANVAQVTALDADVSTAGIRACLDESHSNSHSCKLFFQVLYKLKIPFQKYGETKIGPEKKRR